MSDFLQKKTRMQLIFHWGHKRQSAPEYCYNNQLVNIKQEHIVCSKYSLYAVFLAGRSLIMILNGCKKGISMVFTWIYRLMYVGVGLPGAGFDSSGLRGQ